jgi:hypothetical protein
MMVTTLLLGTFNTLENVLYPSPDMSHHNSILEIYRQVLGLHDIVYALTCTVNNGTLYIQVCFFLNRVQAIELATGGLHFEFGL